MDMQEIERAINGAPMEELRAKELGDFLHAKRIEKGLSIRELGRLTGMSDTTVLRIEQGTFIVPAPDKLARIADILGLELADVFGLARYVAPTQLPTWRPYLRTKYSQLPTEAVDELESFFSYLQSKYGAKAAGPMNGEDEQP
jgi:transcriptional regulator with XRE-family HTH domain